MYFIKSINGFCSFKYNIFDSIFNKNVYKYYDGKLDKINFLSFFKELKINVIDDFDRIIFKCCFINRRNYYNISRM